MNTILRVCPLNKSFGKQEVLTNLISKFKEVTLLA